MDTSLATLEDSLPTKTEFLRYVSHYRDEKLRIVAKLDLAAAVDDRVLAATGRKALFIINLLINFWDDWYKQHMDEMLEG